MSLSPDHLARLPSRRADARVVRAGARGPRVARGGGDEPGGGRARRGCWRRCSARRRDSRSAGAAGPRASAGRIRAVVLLPVMVPVVLVADRALRGLRRGRPRGHARRAGARPRDARRAVRRAERGGGRARDSILGSSARRGAWARRAWQALRRVTLPLVRRGVAGGRSLRGDRVLRRGRGRAVRGRSGDDDAAAEDVEHDHPGRVQPAPHGRGDAADDRRARPARRGGAARRGRGDPGGPGRAADPGSGGAPRAQDDRRGAGRHRPVRRRGGARLQPRPSSPSASTRSRPSMGSALEIEPGELMTLLGPSGLREDDSPEPDRGVRDTGRRGRSRWTAWTWRRVRRTAARSGWSSRTTRSSRI